MKDANYLVKMDFDQEWFSGVCVCVCVCVCVYLIFIYFYIWNIKSFNTN